MAQKKTIFACGNCGYESPKWAGKCPNCGRWNSFEEIEAVRSVRVRTGNTSKIEPVLLNEVSAGNELRVKIGLTELDRVLGGGIVPASVILIAGDPGIGKSTLLLQMAARLKQKQNEVLYISGEESLKQIQSRAKRLQIHTLDLALLVETELENILEQIGKLKPQVVVVDSIQSVFSAEVSGAPGNVSQVRECASQLFRVAKKEGWTLFIVGHITKEGNIAGPKILEHMVDVVVYFEGDNYNQFRILRSLKNRFGATNEIGLFLMSANGLQEVENPSSLFLSQNKNDRVGSGVVCSFEGSRPILAEVQSLVSRSNYGVPQRTVSGFDQRRLALILAILEKHCGLNFGYSDVFVKVVGGLRIDDPGIDLGIAVSIYSSFKGIPLKNHSIYIGELGLNGEIRPVSQISKRIQEAVKLGFNNIYLPEFGKSRPGKNFETGVKIFEIVHISKLFRKT